MLKGYIPEFLAAVAMSVMLLFGFSMRMDMPWPTRYPHPKVHVEPRFLLELETPRGRLRVGTRGEITGVSEGKLSETELIDLRQASLKLKPVKGKGSWKMRFYDEKGVHEIDFEPAGAAPSVQHILENLKILGYLSAKDVKP